MFLIFDSAIEGRVFFHNLFISLDQTLPPWPGGELGDHAGGGSSLGMMPTHSHTKVFRVESM